MSRSITTFLLLTAAAVPTLGQCTRRECTCACAAYSVYPDVTANRRLPGQWWDDHEAYLSAPPAHHAYGIVDHGNKPWSLIPGDGYVGASPNAAPGSDDEDDEDEEDDGTPDEGDTDEEAGSDPRRSLFNGLAPSPHSATKDTAPSDDDGDKPGTDASDDYDAAETDAAGSSADTVDDDAETDQSDSADAGFGFEADRDDEPRSELLTLRVPPMPESAGFLQTLFGFAFLALALAGHFVRKSWRIKNTIPTPTL